MTARHTRQKGIEIMAKYTITHIQHYPIYEPAEGGYYYEGQEPLEWVTVNSLRKAKEIFGRMIKEYGYTKTCNHTALDEERLMTKYIGSGCSIVLRRGNRPERSGRVPYC